LYVFPVHMITVLKLCISGVHNDLQASTAWLIDPERSKPRSRTEPRSWVAVSVSACLLHAHIALRDAVLSVLY